MKTALILAVALALAGCSSLKGTFENRAVCTVSGGQMMAVSLYGPIGIASKIADADAAAVCGPVAASAPSR